MELLNLTKILDARKFDYSIVESQKRYVRIGVESARYYKELITFPKSIFINTRKHPLSHNLDRYYTYALDKSNAICHQPFFNINYYGSVCIYHDSDAKGLANQFYTSPFMMCGDQYCHSLRCYLKFGTCDTRQIENFYKSFSNHELIPLPWGMNPFKQFTLPAKL